MFKKSNFIGVHTEKIENYYRFIKELGHGSFGQVFRVQRITTGEYMLAKNLIKN